jgi:hypothetical protein
MGIIRSDMRKRERKRREKRDDEREGNKGGGTKEGGGERRNIEEGKDKVEKREKLGTKRRKVKEEGWEKGKAHQG